MAVGHTSSNCAAQKLETTCLELSELWTKYGSGPVADMPGLLQSHVEVVTLVNEFVAIDPCKMGLGCGASVVWPALHFTTSTSFN